MATVYHALTQGYLIGEIVRRIAGDSIGKFFREEVALKLDADFYIGVPDSEFSRIGNLIPPNKDTAPASQGDSSSIAFRTF